ncbi:hypothetical protein PMAYCL1PPCAC_27434, partial [Pristionchus mayeri]
SLDMGRFERYGSSLDLKLRVLLKGPNDPIIEQVSGLLSTSINYVKINGFLYSRPLNAEDLSICAQLLRGSIIRSLELIWAVLNDTTVPFIIAMAANIKSIMITRAFFDGPPLSDP